MLIIRLQRIGKNKRPSYRVIISEKGRDTQARSLEILGSYHPIEKVKKLDLKKDRVLYWVSKGAQMSDTIHNLFVKEGVIEAKKRGSVSLTKKRREKFEAKKAEKEKSAESAS